MCFSFLGVSHHTKVCENLDEDAIFDDVFEWPVGRPVENQEVLEIQVLQHNRYFVNRVLGLYGLVLQRLAEDGHLSVCDEIVDENNKPVPGAKLRFEVSYTAPDGSVGAWHAPGLPTSVGSFDDDRQALLDIEQNIANLQRSYAAAAAHAAGGGGDAGGGGSAVLPSQQQPPTPGSEGFGSEDGARSKQGSVMSLFTTSNKSPDRKRSLPAAMKTLAVALKIAKQRPSCDAEEKVKLKDAEDIVQYGKHVPENRSTQSLHRRLSDQTLYLLSGGEAADNAMFIDEPFTMDTAPYSITTPVVITNLCHIVFYTFFQYFVFDFHMAPSMLFDKIVTLTALHNRNIIRSGKVIGSFKLDVGTVFNQPEHQFSRKWAVLTDPDDMTAGPKGYIKCDISVVGKGDTIKPAPKKETDDDDIEGNLLLPDGVPAERQHARFIVRIYRADGLPRVNSGLVANVKRAFSGETRELIDPYVQASPPKRSYCNRARFTGANNSEEDLLLPRLERTAGFYGDVPAALSAHQSPVEDNDAVNDTVVGTHFIEMSKIANEGDKGFLPTFGPSFVYLYGSTRENSLFEEHAPLNDGLGEGVMYRGRLLIAVRTEIFDALDITQSSVDLEPTSPVNEVLGTRFRIGPELKFISTGVLRVLSGIVRKERNFLLFGAILEASMIDRKIGEKPIYFELSIGNSGNTLDGASKWKDDSLESAASADASLETVVVDPVICHSTSQPVKPVTSDRQANHSR
ncbi:hypothetical protein HPB48_004133 [Haemaphysalis longicornis]|uniref:C2 domain-containing protein n=1 Tax=Haemaphysalis longicornis TaxID=44386 RepID=A0A9J6FNN3_HAELO|nr:hypothetical protein HPB48_004133 [Haemaphysalis longicornis]